uniref:Uncharacterized protein n=1 Tax=Sphaerodactylus townsendi TaxID=933632 RepID=A0ACB8F4L3_9SAUR
MPTDIAYRLSCILPALTRQPSRPATPRPGRLSAAPGSVASLGWPLTCRPAALAHLPADTCLPLARARSRPAGLLARTRAARASLLACLPLPRLLARPTCLRAPSTRAGRRLLALPAHSLPATRPPDCLPDDWPAGCFGSPHSAASRLGWRLRRPSGPLVRLPALSLARSPTPTPRFAGFGKGRADLTERANWAHERRVPDFPGLGRLSLPPACQLALINDRPDR